MSSCRNVARDCFTYPSNCRIVSVVKTHSTVQSLWNHYLLFTCSFPKLLFRYFDWWKQVYTREVLFHSLPLSFSLSLSIYILSIRNSIESIDSKHLHCSQMEKLQKESLCWINILTILTELLFLGSLNRRVREMKNFYRKLI